MITVEMNRLLSILISHFGSEGQVKTAEALIKLRDESLGTVVKGGGSANPFTPITNDFMVTDEVRLKPAEWSHSRGIRGVKGVITKVNQKTYKVRFESRPRVIGVPKSMLEAWPQ